MRRTASAGATTLLVATFLLGHRAGPATAQQDELCGLADTALSTLESPPERPPAGGAEYDAAVAQLRALWAEHCGEGGGGEDPPVDPSTVPTDPCEGADEALTAIEDAAGADHVAPLRDLWRRGCADDGGADEDPLAPVCDAGLRDAADAAREQAGPGTPLDDVCPAPGPSTTTTTVSAGYDNHENENAASGKPGAGSGEPGDGGASVLSAVGATEAARGSLPRTGASGMLGAGAFLTLGLAATARRIAGSWPGGA